MIKHYVSTIKLYKGDEDFHYSVTVFDDIAQMMRYYKQIYGIAIRDITVKYLLICVYEYDSKMRMPIRRITAQFP